MKMMPFPLLISLFLLSALSLSALNLGEVKEQMAKRQPAIEALWAAGKIGENNQGFVEARSALSAQETEQVRAENADRKLVYEAIARTTRTSPEKVGLQRAAQISQRADKGLWLQDAAGRWYRK